MLKEVGQDAGILYKKIHAKASINRPVTCPSSYEVFIQFCLSIKTKSRIQGSSKVLFYQKNIFEKQILYMALTKNFDFLSLKGNFSYFIA